MLIFIEEPQLHVTESGKYVRYSSLVRIDCSDLVVFGTFINRPGVAGAVLQTPP